MPACALKEQLVAEMKRTMKSGEKARLLVIRTILAAIKQIEVDERIELEFEQAKRTDLIEIEQTELAIIKEYLPEALSEEEIGKLISAALETTGATEMKQMGQVMGILKPQLQGRADMGKVSQLIKSSLGAN